MSEFKEVGEQNNEIELHKALEAARSRLVDGDMPDYARNIDYTKISAEQLAQVEEEVGLVHDQIPQEPIHARKVEVLDDDGKPVMEERSLAGFVRSQDNFYNCFLPETFIGRLYRKLPPVQRFKILFPELDSLLVKTTPAFSAAQLEQRNVSHADYAENDPYAQSLRVAYGIMSQLVDQDDVIDKRSGKRVRDLEEPLRKRFLTG